jgi:hypothetical protein
MALPGLITVSPSSSELVATMQRVKPSIAGQEQARPGCALCADASNESNALTHTEASLENSNNQTKASLPPLPAARAGLSQPPMHPHPWPSVGSASRSCLLAKLTTHKQHTAHTQGSCAGTQTAEKLAYLPAPRTLAAAVRSRDDVQQACTSRTCKHTVARTNTDSAGASTQHRLGTVSAVAHCNAQGSHEESAAR